MSMELGTFDIDLTLDEVEELRHGGRLFPDCGEQV